MTKGRFHLVPAVRVTEWRGLRDCWIPVMGPKHEDAEHVKFPWPHFHVDWRYVPQRVWNRFWSNTGRHYGMPIQCPDMRGNKVIAEGPTLRRFTLKRDGGAYPIKSATWRKSLGESMGCQKLMNGLCPHRGIPVSAMQRDGDILTCPGHGLRWHAITGELVQ
jgi:hypothetical protein